MTPKYKAVPILDAARRAGVRIADGQAGRYEVKAFCPFCLGRTKNPHLYLNTEKNRFFCQRCGEHGNSVSLYAKIRGISNKEAFKELEKSNLQMFPQAGPKEQRQEYMAPLEQRHDVYYDLLALLSLSEYDFLDLLGRGLTLDAIEQNMYRSMPAKMEARSELAQTLSRIHDLDGVPGFYRSENGDWRLAGNSGLLIPYCTAKGIYPGHAAPCGDWWKTLLCMGVQQPGQMPERWQSALSMWNKSARMDPYHGQRPQHDRFHHGGSAQGRYRKLSVQRSALLMRTWGQCNQVPSLSHPFTFCGTPFGGI